MRKVIINNSKLRDILGQRGELFKVVSEINEKLYALDKERKKLAYKMDKLKDKTKVIMDKTEVGLGEFEVITNVGLEESEATVTIIDQLDEYAKLLREKGKNEGDN